MASLVSAPVASTPWLSRVIVISRTNGRPSPSAISSRVELLPQSSAATLVTDRLDAKFGQGNLRRNECANGIDVAREIVGNVGVQALQSLACSANTPTGLWPIDAHRGGLAAATVVLVGRHYVGRVNQFFKSVHAAVAFESTDFVIDLGINKPVQGGHRRAVAHVWLVLNDHRRSIEASHHDGTATVELSTNQGLNGSDVLGGGVAKGAQRQNSSVRRNRDTNPGCACCVVVVATVAEDPLPSDDEFSGFTKG